MSAWGGIPAAVSGSQPIRGETLPPPYDGIDTDSAPDTLLSTKAPVVENFLTDRPGRLPMRGPINEATASLAVSAGRKPVGIWKFNDNLLIGYREVDAVKVRDPWTVNYRTATAAQLASAALATRHVNLTTAVITNIVPTTVDLVPGPSHTRLGAFTYGISFDTPTAAVNENGTFKKLTSLTHWDGTATSPVVHANAPRGAQAVRAHLQRLFVLGGRNPDGTGTIAQNTLWWSDPISGVTVLPDTLVAWQDDTSGLTNQLIVDSDDPSDFGVGLAKVGANLVIFKRRSIHVLTGYSSTTWQIKTFTTEQGCIDARSIVEYEDMVFFMSDQGYMAFDGQQLTTASQGLRSSLLAAAITAVGNAGQDGGRVSAGRLPNGYIALSVGNSPSAATTDASTTTFCALFHAGRGTWSTLQSDALVGGYPIYLDRSSSKTFMLDDDKVIQANKLTAPEQDQAANRGMDATDALFRWDAGSGFTGTLNTLRSAAGVEMFPAGQAQYAIKSTFVSRLAKLASPLERARLYRIITDYNFQIVGGTDQIRSALGNGWFVKVNRGDSTVLVPEWQVHSQGDNTTYLYRRRDVKRASGHCNDAQITVQWRGTARPLAKADILSMTIEYMSGGTQRTQ